MAWQVVRHQVAIAGTVTDGQTNRAIEGALVKLTDAPQEVVVELMVKAKSVTLRSGAPESAHRARAILGNAAATNRDKLASAQTVLDYLQNRRRAAISLGRPDVTFTAADGHYHFLDLPDGTYGLAATVPRAGTRYATTPITDVNVSSDEKPDGRKIVMAVADATLWPKVTPGHAHDRGTRRKGG